ncbi:hypothetical protein D3C77_431300 [compost metagenome]
MHTAGGQANNCIARCNLASVNNLALIYYPYREPGNIILALGVHAWHFCGFATDQGAARLTAAICNSGHNRLDLGRNYFIAGEVVQEKERLRPLNDNVIDAHRHRVNPDRIMLVHRKSDFQLRSDAIRPRNEDWLLIFIFVQAEQSAKAAQIR